MNNVFLKIVSAVSISLVCLSIAFSQESPVEKALENPGAHVTLPVTAAKEPFPKDFVNQAQNSFTGFHAQMGGDHTLYYLQNFSSVMRTDLVAPNSEYSPFEYALNPDIEKISITTDSEGPLEL